MNRDAHRAFFRGVRTGVPIAVGYLPISMAFGVLARSAGLPEVAAVAMSVLVYAGASQFVAVNLLALGVAWSEIVMTTFLLNLRHLLMTAALSRRIEPGVPKPLRALVAYGVTDETFAVASLEPDATLRPAFLLGLGTIAFTAWNIGTALGLVAGAALPEALQASLGIALYAMFLGLVIPPMRTSRSVAAVAATAALTHAALATLTAVPLSPGWRIVLATVVGAAVGTVLMEDREGGKKPRASSAATKKKVSAGQGIPHPQNAATSTKEVRP
ncbi:MAG: AzlC family ABC transporter permease [Calditerricola sp.]|nr:AzlC family ABC transporter permease [Calditerricola sp.]